MTKGSEPPTIDGALSQPVFVCDCDRATRSSSDALGVVSWATSTFGGSGVSRLIGGYESGSDGQFLSNRPFLQRVWQFAIDAGVGEVQSTTQLGFPGNLIIVAKNGRAISTIDDTSCPLGGRSDHCSAGAVLVKFSGDGPDDKVCKRITHRRKGVADPGCLELSERSRAQRFAVASPYRFCGYRRRSTALETLAVDCGK
ncbi:hypothetical protein RW1_062_00100 [Rhodococcus wratislaviensis NBRC 100605]|uniref:Uncharacterized protein n=1 Tax=Rhodococcus wratislaviensis NBRC 100605 TaxID=1219028 RepID=X0QDA5_RHOWR|nr:hypothetical protein RW1_062_00100 [Rhodococcus wratislaviensis NBRC 100605]